MRVKLDIACGENLSRFEENTLVVFAETKPQCGVQANHPALGLTFC